MAQCNLAPTSSEGPYNNISENFALLFFFVFFFALMHPEYLKNSLVVCRHMQCIAYVNHHKELC